jgi:hypothetical protein
MPRVETEFMDLDNIASFVRSKERNLPHVIDQQLKGSIYDTPRESFDAVQERAISQTYREIILTIAEKMGKDISDDEVLRLSTTSGLSFGNIAQLVEAHFENKGSK